jgi:hypothetical protein
MNSHLPEKKVKVVFKTLKGVSGTIIVTDGKDSNLKEVVLDTSDLSSGSYTYIVDEDVNDIGLLTRDFRTVTFTETDSEGIETEFEHLYYLFPKTILIIAENSFGTLNEALLLTPALSKLKGWDSVDQKSKIAAMCEAYDQVSRFPLKSYFTNKYPNNYTPEQWAKVNTKIRLDFLKAQLTQADFLLGGSPEETFRKQGMISRSVGESTSFFRTSFKLNVGISDRSYEYINRYIEKNISISRA